MFLALRSPDPRSAPSKPGALPAPGDPFTAAVERHRTRQPMENRNTVAPAARAETGALPEARFRELVEGLDAVVWEMDAGTGCFTYVSPQAERLLGNPPERWYGDPSFWADRLVHPEDRERVVPRRASATAGARDHELDYRARAADGRIVWLHDVARVVRDSSGRPWRLRGVMVDVTERREAERKLQERIRHAALSAEVGDAIADGGTLREVLQRCAAAVVAHLDAAFARVWTLNEPEQVLELRASAGLYTHLDGAHGRVPVGSFKIGLIAEEREPHLTNDVRNDPRVSDKEWARREGMVSFAGYPLLVEGRVVGVMAMFARHPLAESTLDALRAVAERVAVIVERKETDLALRERELQLAEAQRIAHLGSWEWEVGPNRVSWSDELYRIYGLLPQSEECTLQSYLARVHPDDRERVKETIGEVYRTGRTFEFEERIVRPDGSVRVLLSRGRAVTDRSGEVAKLVGTCQDVTEQREAAAREMELAREQAARLRAEEEEARAAFLAEAGRVLSSSLDFATTLRNFAHLAVPRLADWCAIDVVDEEGAVQRVVTAHPDPAKEELARELERRYPSDPTASTGVYGVLRSGEPELVPEIPPEMIEAGARDAEHLRIIRELQLRSYMVLPLLARGRTLGAITFVAAESGRRFDEEDLRFAGELASRAALAVDNARLYTDQMLARRQVEQKAEELARLARQLEITNAELDQFAYVASHDLKAPLRGIANLSQWIEEDLEGEMSPEVREHLDLLRGRVHRMEGLIDGILQYSRAGRVREKPEPVEVGALLEEVVDLLSPPEGFEVVVGGGMPSLLTERLPLQQVFMNLIGNAAKYSAGPGGRVEVRVEPEEGFHHFVVADNGPGIAPEYHERIFGIFQTLEARDKVEGTGIGLSLVRKIVEARGGRVWVESEEGAGASFHFLWPGEARES